ncbi:HPP family protein [Cribrihabitans neustonicus]|uniref:HPP family protein n=1 Tax=Cribrihabitans neustonicus TaxID=1429085 RepID=UPI003B5984F6
MRRILSLARPRAPLFPALAAGFGGILAIASLSLLPQQAELMLLMAPFGASCVLLFLVPASPLSQPANVIGGHAVAALIGLAANALLPDSGWAMALAVGLAITAMALLRLTHPPAGADPLVVFASDPGLGFLLFPVISGAAVLVAMAALYHRLSGGRYPVRPGTRAG